MPAVIIPETPPSGSSSGNECEASPPAQAKPKPGKQVRFKTSSSSAESDNEIKLSVRSQEPRFVSCSTYSSSDTDSADIIQNAQACKYSEQNDNRTTDDGNDEESPDILPETLPSQIPNEDQGQTQPPVEDIAPTPVRPDGMTQVHVEDCPMTSTPNQSVNGVYSLVANQPTLSTL